MRRAALSLLAILSFGCNKDGDAVDDTDVVDDTVIVDTDGDTDVDTVPSMGFEIDPEASQVYLASLTVGEKTSDGDFGSDGEIAYRVAEFEGNGFFRHYAGALQVDNPLPNGPAKITLAMDVVVPDDADVGPHSCVGPKTGYAVGIVMTAGDTPVAALSSLSLAEDDDRPCQIRIQKIDDTHFQATINEATVAGKAAGREFEALVSNTTINLRLRAKAE